MPETYASLCYTTVAAGGYVSGATALNVASTSTGSGLLPFPTTVPFSIVGVDVATGLPKALLRVTAFASATQFTVSMAGGVNGNLAVGDLVYAILDKTALDLLRADINQQGYDASLPSTTGQKTGNVYHSSTKPRDHVFDGAAWKAFERGLLASLFVATDETTTSASYVDLTTPDSVTFLLLAAATVVIRYTANSYQGSGAEGMYNIVNIDGADITSPVTETGYYFATASYSATTNCDYVVALGSGSHTIKIRHKVSAGTGHWRQRTLTVEKTN